MVRIPDEAIQLIIREDGIVEIGSVDEQGITNISPRYVMSAEDERLIFADVYKNKTYTNIMRWPKATAAIIDKVNRAGFQLKGDVEIIRDPTLVSQCTKKLDDLGFESSPVMVWSLNIKEIFSIKPSEESKKPLFSVYR